MGDRVRGRGLRCGLSCRADAHVVDFNAGQQAGERRSLNRRTDPVFNGCRLAAASGVRPSVECFRRNRCERADSGILSRHQKFFCKNVFHRKATPFLGQTVFGQIFGRGAVTKISKWKVPPTGGQALQSARIIGARLGSPISRCQTGRARADRPGHPGWQCCPHSSLRSWCALTVQ